MARKKKKSSDSASGVLTLEAVVVKKNFKYYKTHYLRKIKERKNHLLRILNITDWFMKNMHFSLVLHMHFYIQKFVSFTLKLPDESVGMEQR